MSDTLYYSDVNTRFGIIGLIWNPMTLKVQRILLQSEAEQTLKRPEVLPPEIKNLLDSFKRFLQGENVAFDLDLLDFGQCTEFQKKVLLAEYHIPRGTISTYSRIAQHIGTPKAARAVGNALATNPFPLAIPCHRAVRSDLTLGGYQGGIEMKKQLLEMEGIRISNNRAYKPTMTY